MVETESPHTIIDLRVSIMLVSEKYLLVNWSIKPIEGYILAHRDFGSKITLVYERLIENTTYMLIEKFSQYLFNCFIGQLI